MLVVACHDWSWLVFGYVVVLYFLWMLGIGRFEVQKTGKVTSYEGGSGMSRKRFRRGFVNASTAFPTEFFARRFLQGVVHSSKRMTHLYRTSTQLL